MFSPVVSVSVLNPFHGHSLFFYALHATITMILNLKMKYGILSSMYNLMDDDFVVA
jgi:hypothetical protein